MNFFCTSLPNRKFPLEVLDGPFMVVDNCIVKGRISNRIGDKECVRVHLPHPLNQSRLEGPFSIDIYNQMQQSAACAVTAMHLKAKLRERKRGRKWREKQLKKKENKW